MPESGIKFVPRQELLSYEEMLRLVHLLVQMGIKKVRITGGEPFVRKDLVKFLEKLSEIEGLEIHITTNGVLTKQYLPILKKINIKSINLSLDSLDKKRFHKITRRDEFENVMDCFHAILDYDIPLKVNTVVMEDNIEDIIPLVDLTKKYPVNVRFIEEMPFNGSNDYKPSLSHTEILDHIKRAYPILNKIKDEEGTTAHNYDIPGHIGSVGIIAAYTRTFCGSCNRIRITAIGELKTCLYDNGVLNLKALITNGATDDDLRYALLNAFSNRSKDGFEAEKGVNYANASRESMTTIGG